MAHVEVMAHGTQLFTAALRADEYLVVQIKGAISWLNQLEPQLTTAEFAARRWRGLDERAHMISFRRHDSEREQFFSSASGVWFQWLEELFVPAEEKLPGRTRV